MSFLAFIIKYKKFKSASATHPKATQYVYTPGTFQDQPLQPARWRPQLRPPGPCHQGTSRCASPEGPPHSWGRTLPCRPSRQWQSESRYPPWTARGTWPPRTTALSLAPCKTGWRSGCCPAPLTVWRRRTWSAARRLWWRRQLRPY